MRNEIGAAMDRRRFVATASALSVGILSGWACGSPPEPEVGDLPPRVVGLRSMGGSFRFDPPGLRVQPGDEVRWLNMGDFHTVTAFHPDNDHLVPGRIHLRMPEGAPSYHSGMLGLTAGTQFAHRFELEGVYDYFCQPHYSFGMVGRLIVGEPGEDPALTLPADDLIEAARANMPPAEAITGPEGASFEWAARVNGILFTLVNEGEGLAAARAVARGVTEDRALERWLGDQGAAALESAMSDLVDEVRGPGGYEAVLHRADDVKTVLRRTGQAA